MDYMHFLDEFDTYNEWNRLQRKDKEVEDTLDNIERHTFPSHDHDV